MITFKGRGKENQVRPSTQKTEPLNAVNKKLYVMYTKRRDGNIQQKQINPDFIMEQNPLLIRLWKNILDHRTRIFFQIK